MTKPEPKAATKQELPKPHEGTKAVVNVSLLERPAYYVTRAFDQYFKDDLNGYP